MAIDPSEAVRSEEILPLLKEYFTVGYLKNSTARLLIRFIPCLILS